MWVLAVLIAERVLHVQQQHMLRVPEEILCLGLGSPSSSRNARAQLVFLMRLREDLAMPGDKITLYDPVFTVEDKHLLGANLGLNVKSDEEDIGYALSVPTIAYMPHCDMALYESFLRANWTRERLSLVVLVANNLVDYVENNSSRKMSKEFPCILRLASYLTSRYIPTSMSHTTAFNNMSIQRLDILPLADHPFWHNIPLSTSKR